jgi:hypothetical protein
MTPETRLAEMVAERQSRKDELDLPHTLTRREADLYIAETTTLDSRIIAARGAMATLLELEVKVAPDEKWFADLTEWRADFCQKLMAIKPGDRSRETQELQQGLRLSITNIDKGCITWPNGAAALGAQLAEAIKYAGWVAPKDVPGPAWYGCLPEVKERIAKMQKRIDAAQIVLDDALLIASERAKKDADSAARRDKLNATPMRKTRGNGSQYDKWPDGRTAEITS